MATIINTDMAEQYGIKHTSILQRELKNDISKLEPFITIMPGCKGRSVEVPYMGGVDSTRRSMRFEQIERGEMMFGNRHMRAKDFYIATKFGNDDRKYNVNIEFQLSHITTEHRSRANRDKDEVILGVRLDTTEGSPTKGLYIKDTVATAPTDVYNGVSGGILGTNYTGIDGITLEDLGDTDTGDAKTSSVVPVDFTYSGTEVDCGLELQKLIRGKEMLTGRNAFVPGRNTAVVAMSARQIAEIQLWEQSQNKNYGFGDLVNGFQNRVLGINIMQTEMLPWVNLGTSSAPKLVQICPMWVKEYACFGVWDDMQVQITPRLQGYVDMGEVLSTYAFGAMRTHKQAVVQIQCLGR